MEKVTYSLQDRIFSLQCNFLVMYVAQQETFHSLMTYNILQELGELSLPLRFNMFLSVLLVSTAFSDAPWTILNNKSSLTEESIKADQEDNKVMR